MTPSPRAWLWTGLTLMAVGSLDPLEGSLLIAPGLALMALGAHRGQCRQRRGLLVAAALGFVGVAALWGLSALGGVGGDTHRSAWWLLTCAPYPIGWAAGWVGGIGALRDLRKGTPHAPE